MELVEGVTLLDHLNALAEKVRCQIREVTKLGRCQIRKVPN